MVDRKNFDIELEGSTYKLSLYIEKKDLLIVLSSPIQFIPISYEKKMKKSDFSHLSNYFNRFTSLNDICNNIANLIEEGKYTLKKDEMNTGYLILILYPDPIDEPDGNPIEIELKIPIVRISSDSIVNNLFEIITDMSMQINELNEKVKKLESDHVSQKQIVDSNKSIEKINVKLNKIKRSNLELDKNYFNRLNAVRSTNVLLCSDDNNLFKNWLNSGNIKLSLIYKATVDSDFGYAFHSKCDDHAPTITIVKTDQGIRFGGYTTKTWNCKEECKRDDEAFLFSLDFRKKYPIKKGTECAIYCNNEYGPTFGEGFDLCLCDNYMGVNGSYSNFPTSYGKGNATNELTGKYPNFRIADVEVYQVNFHDE
jgi:hypothetical protein